VFTHSESKNGLLDNYTRTSHEVELYMYICFNKSTREYPHFLVFRLNYYLQSRYEQLTNMHLTRILGQHIKATNIISIHIKRMNTHINSVRYIEKTIPNVKSNTHQ